MGHRSFLVQFFGPRWLPGFHRVQPALQALATPESTLVRCRAYSPRGRQRPLAGDEVVRDRPCQGWLWKKPFWFAVPPWAFEIRVHISQLCLPLLLC